MFKRNFFDRRDYFYKKFKLVLFLFLFVLLLSMSASKISATSHLTIFSPNYFNEQKNEYNTIHYLKNELLSFEVCFDNSINDLSVSINGINSNREIKLNYQLFKDNCYFVNYQLNRTNLSKFRLKIDYVENNKKKEISREFNQEKESNLPTHILNQNITSLDPLELSYYLLVLSNFKPLKDDSVQKAYDLLKVERDNENKCWPSGSCSVMTTAKILRNLKLAGYGYDSRLLSDGLVYLEKNIDKYVKGHNSHQTDSYNVVLFIKNDFNNTGDVDCDFSTDDNNYTYSFTSSDEFNDLMIEKSVDSNYDLKCDNNLDEIRYFVFNNELQNRVYDDTNQLTYELSDYLKQKYNSFYYVIKVKDDFNTDNDCRLIVDGDEKEMTFSNESSDDEKLLEGTFNDKVELKCDNDIDKTYFYVFTDKTDDKTVTNSDHIEDSVNLAEKYKFDISLKYDFSHLNKLICNLKVDSGDSGSYEKEYTFSKDDELVIKDNYASKSINLVCNDKVYNARIKVYNNFNNPEIDSSYDYVSQISTTIPENFGLFACVQNNNVCDLEATFESLIAYSSKLEDYDKLLKYVQNFIVKDNDNYEKFNTLNPIIDTGKYLLIESQDSLGNFLKFRQNNDGSWGDSEKLLKTSWAVIGLDKIAPDSEHLSDGINWIYFNEPTEGWGSLIRNSLAYEAIKEKIKSRIVINDFNQIKNSTKLSILNPTIYNLRNVKVSFSKEINDYIKGRVDLGDLSQDESVETNLSVVPTLIGSKTGFMTISAIDDKNNKIDLLKVPLKLVGKEPLSPKEKTIIITKDKKSVVIPISKIANLNYECSYKNPFTQKEGKVIINEKTEEITFLNNKLIAGSYKIVLNCKDQNSATKEMISVPLEFNVSIVNESFNILTRSVSLSSSNSFSVKLQNLQKQKLVLRIAIPSTLNQIVKTDNKYLVLAPNEIKEIYFDVIDLDKLETLNGLQYITFTDEKGFNKKISLSSKNVESVQSTKLSFKDYVIIFIIGIILLVVLAYFYKRYREYKYYLSEMKQESEDLDDDLVFDLEE